MLYHMLSCTIMHWKSRKLLKFSSTKIHYTEKMEDRVTDIVHTCNSAAIQAHAAMHFVRCYTCESVQKFLVCFRRKLNTYPKNRYKYMTQFQDNTIL